MKKNIIIIGLLLLSIIAVFALKQKKQPHPPAQATASSQQLPMLLELGSVTCIPCKTMAPILEELASTYTNQLTVGFIDVWQDAEAKQKYAIQAIPTQIFFDAQGTELFRHEGFLPRADILAKWAELGINLVSPRSGN